MGSDSESVSTLASESSVSEQKSRARQQLLHKRLRDRDRQISDKDAELVQLRGQLDAKDRVVQELSDNVNELQLRLSQSVSLISTQDVPPAAETDSYTQVITHYLIVSCRYWYWRAGILREQCPFHQVSSYR